MVEFRYNDDGTLDELCARNAYSVHLEQLDEDCWCLNLSDAEGGTLLYLYAKPKRHRYWWGRILASIFGRPACHVNVLESNEPNNCEQAKQCR